MMMATDLQVSLERRCREETGEKAPALRLSEAGVQRKAKSGPAKEVIRKVNFAPGHRKAPPPRFAARRRSGPNAAAVGPREPAI
jgi:hypothetical protein